MARYPRRVFRVPRPALQLPSVGPPDATPLPPAEKAAEGAPQVNDIQNSGGNTAATPAATTGKTPKPAYDSSKDSSSKHKKKKGLEKLNPF